MTLFGGEYQADLSDQGLLHRLDSQKEELAGASLEPDTDRNLGRREEPEGVEVDRWALSSPGTQTGDSPEQQEASWAQAQRQLWSDWPQSKGDMVRLVQKMAEISARYGDPALWQRDPAGTLRYAALEIYGPPGGQREQERLERQRQRRHSLAPSALRHGAPAPLTPEQEILQDIVRARRNGVL